jgi:hypothetical protein
MGIPPIVLAQPAGAIPKPNPVAKPTPPGKTTQASPPQFATDQFAKKETEFMNNSVKAHTEDQSITLLSTFGYFKVFDFDLVLKNSVKQKAVFFVNKASQTVCEVHGHIVLHYLNIIPKRDAVTDFPISDERLLKANKKNRISRFCNYTLDWDSGTFKVTKTIYKEFDPVKETSVIAFAEEYDLDNKNIVVTNWKSVLKNATYKAYGPFRFIRPTGTPNQILLHETASRQSLGVLMIAKNQYKGKDIYYIPHFCVNNLDAQQKGSITQFVDIAEETYHGELMNERSVGIEFVNTPVEGYVKEKDGEGKEIPNGKNIPVFKLPEATDGIYLKTVLKNYSQLFIPLEFSPDKGDPFFELEIPKDKLVNVAALLAKKVNKQNIATETTKGVITIKYCKSEKFEHLVSLMNLLAGKDILDIKLDDIANWCCFNVQKDQTVFMFDRAYTKQKDKPALFGIDVRKKGIYNHGLISSDHGDGYLQAIYTYYRIFKKMATHEETLKKLIDLIMNGTVVAIKLKVLVEYFNEIITDHTGGKEIDVTYCLVV